MSHRKSPQFVFRSIWNRTLDKSIYLPCFSFFVSSSSLPLSWCVYTYTYTLMWWRAKCCWWMKLFPTHTFLFFCFSLVFCVLSFPMLSGERRWQRRKSSNVCAFVRSNKRGKARGRETIILFVVIDVFVLSHIDCQGLSLGRVLSWVLRYFFSLSFR